MMSVEPSVIFAPAKESTTGLNDGLYLFTTKTCPNCKIAQEYLKGVPYSIIEAEENPELSRKLSIMQAPTLVEVKEGSVNKYVNASNIKKFVDQQTLSL